MPVLRAWREVWDASLVRGHGGEVSDAGLAGKAGRSGMPVSRAWREVWDAGLAGRALISKSSEVVFPRCSLGRLDRGTWVVGFWGGYQ